ncbi:MAG: pantetheine-phosphate adenylyltransferase [Gammaproteobacteria bacterium]|nr:pantetheine-phosphate adenylyltransferase [Gammaproteobacteria bacterium]
MKIGLYPGSFDPITLGHIGVIEKGAKLFDKLYICVLNNIGKKPMFSVIDRVKMIEEATKRFPNVVVISESGLTVDACKKHGAEFILRGLRSSADFEYEFESNNVNQTLSPDIKTVLVMTNIEHSHISSSVVRELISFNSKEYEKLVPIEVFNYIESKQ